MNNINNRRSILTASLMAVPACQMKDGDTEWFPAVDVTKTREEYVAEVDLPGLKAEQIQLSVDSEWLSISGQRLQPPRAGSHLRIERPSGAFFRQLPLPPDAHGEIRAILCDGVLELHVPRTCPESDPEQTQAIAPEPGEAAQSPRPLQVCGRHKAGDEG